MLKKLPLLRGLAITAVLANHATAWGFIAMFWWTDLYRPVTVPNWDQLGGPAYWLLVIVNQLALFAVPAFLFISGYFIAYAAQGDPPHIGGKVLRSRLVGVALPYVIWSAIFFAIDAALGVFHPPLTYVRKIILGDVISGFYYVPLLCQFYLISPLLVRWARSHPRRLLAITGAWQLLMVGLPYIWGLWGDAVAAQHALRAWDWTFPRWTFYFALGIVAGFSGKRFTAWLARYRRQLLAAAVVLGVLAVAESQILFGATAEWDWAFAPLKLSSAIYAPTCVLAFLSFNSKPSLSWRLLDHLGAFSFGIFLVHGKALELLAKVIYHLAPGLLAQQVALAAVLFVVVLGGGWWVLRTISRSPVRRFYHYFFG